ncbi:hypothetical protein [Filomicrobium sp.]|uniref:hypothetical protein n=1 Tax=Filomicrobium sp. TaxID=2024831 RepID=UPI002586E2C1|nr:hypothetical protein [Filomicrobium sp.]MCV0368718.1 hypothetical protein [Filomicrobium sp.]
MEVTQQGRRTRPAGKGRFAEALVLVSMALFTFALGTAAHLHGGLDVWTSLTMSVVILICLMALHAIVRGRRAVYAMKSQISQLEDQIEQLGANSVDVVLATPTPDFRRNLLVLHPGFGAGVMARPWIVRNLAQLTLHCRSLHHGQSHAGIVQVMGCVVISPLCRPPYRQIWPSRLPCAILLLSPLMMENRARPGRLTWPRRRQQSVRGKAT